MNQPIADIFPLYSYFLRIPPIMSFLIQPSMKFINFFPRCDLLNFKRIMVGFITQFSMAIDQFANDKCRVKNSFLQNSIGRFMIVFKAFHCIVFLK